MTFDDLFDLGLFSGPSYSQVSHDRYDVYVNQNYIGQKALLTAQESVRDIDDFLRNEGYRHFQTFIDGNHYYINAVGDEQHEVANVLTIYLQNR